MGIYTPGMELPRHCFGCSTKINPDNRRCNIDGHLFEETLSKISSRRDEACPLVHVPPHGRLGDLDALKERATKRLYASNHGSMAEAYWAAIVDLIDNAPTIIPAEEAQL